MTTIHLSAKNSFAQNSGITFICFIYNYIIDLMIKLPYCLCFHIWDRLRPAYLRLFSI